MSFFDWRMFSNMIILQYLYFFKWGHGLWEFLWDLVKWESVLWVDYFTILKELLDLLLNNTLICILPRATVDEIIKTKGLKVRKKKRRKEIRSLVACFIHTKPQIKMSSCRQYPLKFSFWLWKQIKVVMFWACELISTVCKCVKKKQKKKQTKKHFSYVCKGYTQISYQEDTGAFPTHIWGSKLLFKVCSFYFVVAFLHQKSHDLDKLGWGAFLHAYPTDFPLKRTSLTSPPVDINV